MRLYDTYLMKRGGSAKKRAWSSSTFRRSARKHCSQKLVLPSFSGQTRAEGARSGGSGYSLRDERSGWASEDSWFSGLGHCSKPGDPCSTCSPGKDTQVTKYSKLGTVCRGNYNRRPALMTKTYGHEDEPTQVARHFTPSSRTLVVMAVQIKHHKPPASLGLI